MAGCATHYIPNTDVEDNDDNRKIIAFCEKYRHAVEERNVPLLLDMASPRYYEDGGNVDAADDMDYAGLREYLEGRFKDTRAIRYEIRYRRVRHPSENKVLVEYTYTPHTRSGAEGRECARRCRQPARAGSRAGIFKILADVAGLYGGAIQIWGLTRTARPTVRQSFGGSVDYYRLAARLGLSAFVVATAVSCAQERETPTGSTRTR